MNTLKLLMISSIAIPFTTIYGMEIREKQQLQDQKEAAMRDLIQGSKSYFKLKAEVDKPLHEVTELTINANQESTSSRKPSLDFNQEKMEVITGLLSQHVNSNTLTMNLIKGIQEIQLNEQRITANQGEK